MQQIIQKLRQEILRIAALENLDSEEVFLTEEIKTRPAFLLAPMSYIGMQKGLQIAQSMNNVISAIDDHTHSDEIHGVPRWSSTQFKERISKYPDAIAIDFSCSPRSKKFFEALCNDSGVEQISLAKQAPPIIEDFDNRPKFFMAPMSIIAEMHMNGILGQTSNVVAAIDDTLHQKEVHGIPVWNSTDFIDKAKQYPNAMAIDFSYTPLERGAMRKLCELTGTEKIDAGVAIAHCGQHAVYEPARVYRQRTLLRLNEFLNLADRLEDELSVFTLYSNLLFRLTYDRSHLLPALSTPTNEYFSASSDTSTFRLGQREHFCDCGAFQGPIVQKFLEASNFQYESITAFEPDSINFQILKKLSSPLTPNFRPINKAVSNIQETLRFKETGTVSSYASPDGNISVSTTRLDDELEKITLLKMDVEGFEAKVLEGASRLISAQRPRIAVCVYHYALDLLDVVEQLDKMVDSYHLRLRQHSNGYYYDLVLYASPVPGNAPPPWAS
ncbi:MAG: FkbM family methyltransferase [Delftia sp.]|jgi:FkbM family methyltransferase|nr:FkbM family methyltransferase [Delftia sp.]